MARTCKRCGDKLKPYQAVYCSVPCRAKHSYTQPAFKRPCAQCGKTFKAKVSHARWCSLSCKGRARYAPVKASNRRECTCQSCGAAFVTTDSRQVWCSPACKKREIERRRVRIRPRTRLRVVPQMKPCANCGVGFECATANRHYCGDSCRREANRRRQAGSGYVAPTRTPSIKVVSRAGKKPAPVPVADILQDPERRGVGYSGYSEDRPREAQTSVAGCPRCRAGGRDHTGRIIHSSWCGEVA